MNTSENCICTENEWRISQTKDEETSFFRVVLNERGSLDFSYGIDQDVLSLEILGGHFRASLFHGMIQAMHAISLEQSLLVPEIFNVRGERLDPLVKRYCAVNIFDAYFQLIPIRDSAGTLEYQLATWFPGPVKLVSVELSANDLKVSSIKLKELYQKITLFWVEE